MLAAVVNATWQPASAIFNQLTTDELAAVQVGAHELIWGGAFGVGLVRVCVCVCWGGG